MSKSDICKIDDCCKPVVSMDWCSMHHTRYKRHGNPLFTKKTPNGTGLNWLKDVVATATPNGCIVWPYGRSGGYGQVKMNGVKFPAHRLALIFHSGDPKHKDMLACHEPLICHNRLCINPYHLRWGTHQDNHDDMRIDGTRKALFECRESECSKRACSGSYCKYHYEVERLKTLPICKLEGCDKRASTKIHGVCKMHQTRMDRNGSYGDLRTM